MATETLSDLIVRVMRERNLTEADVARHSGGLLSQSHLNRLKNGARRTIKPATAKGLAKGLGVDINLIFDILQGQAIEATEEELYHERLMGIERRYDSLSDESKIKIDYLLSIAEREMRRLARTPKDAIEDDGKTKPVSVGSDGILEAKTQNAKPKAHVKRKQS